MIKNEIGNVTSPNRIKLDSSRTDAVYKGVTEMAKKSTAELGFGLPGEVLYGKKKIRKMVNAMFFSIFFMVLSNGVMRAFPISLLFAAVFTAVYSFLIDRISFKFTVGICGLLFFFFFEPMANAVIHDVFVKTPWLGESPLEIAAEVTLGLLLGGGFTFWFYMRRKNDVRALLSKKKRRFGK